MADEAQAAETPATPEQTTEQSNDPPALDRKAQLAALAKELGYDVADDRVEVAERKRFRDERRKFKAQRDAELAMVRREAEHVRQLAEAKRAFEAGDLDAALRVAFGIDANEVVKRNLAKIKGEDPRVTELQRRLQAKEAEEARVREEAAKSLQTRKLEEAREKHRTELASVYRAAETPALRTLADVPAFVEQCRALQEQEWDGYSTISDVDAAKRTLRAWQESYRLLSKAFGPDVQPSQVAETARAVAAAPQAKSGARKPTITQTRAAEAAPATRPAPTHSDWKAKFAALIDRATDD